MKTLRDYMNMVTLNEDVNFPHLGGGWSEVDASTYRNACIKLNITSASEGPNTKFFILSDQSGEPQMTVTVIGLGSMSIEAQGVLKNNTQPDQGWTQYVQGLFKQLHTSAEITFNGQSLQV